MLKSNDVFELDLNQVDCRVCYDFVPVESTHILHVYFIGIVTIIWKLRCQYINHEEHEYICVSKLTIVGSVNGLPPGRCAKQLFEPMLEYCGRLGTNFRDIVIGIYIFSLMKLHLKTSSAKCRPFCLGLNVLKFDIGDKSRV